MYTANPNIVRAAISISAGIQGISAPLGGVGPASPPSSTQHRLTKHVRGDHIPFSAGYELIYKSDLSKLAQECKRMMDAGCDWLHMDVMDGNFVPNITMGAPILSCVRDNVPGIFMDCHMMVADPAKWVPEIAEAGGKSYTFHYESTSDHQKVIDLIHSHKMLAGLAISPETPSSAITTSLGQSADLLLVMTVRPGRGGQKFMPECLEKVEDLRKRFPGKNIQVDGGVGKGNACQCAKAGSNVLVAGTAIFGAEDPKATIKELRGAVEQELK